MKKRVGLFRKMKGSINLLLSFTGFSILVINLFIAVGIMTYLGYEQTIATRKSIASEVILETHDPEVAKSVQKYWERDSHYFLPTPTRMFIAKFTKGFIYKDDINEPSYRTRMERAEVVKGYGYGDGYVEIKD